MSAELPPRVLQALTIYAECWSRKETARRMGITEQSVKVYLARAHRYYRVQTTGEVYVALGWLAPRYLLGNYPPE